MRRLVAVALVALGAGRAMPQEFPRNLVTRMGSPTSRLFTPTRYYKAGSSLALSLPLTTNGALIPDDAGTVAHVTWSGASGLPNDSKGNVWSKIGGGPVAVLANVSPFSPGKGGAGGFTVAKYITLGTGADVMDFAGDFTACVVMTAGGTNAIPISNGFFQAGGWEIQTFPTQTTVYFNGAGTSSNASSNGAVTAGPSIACWGRAGSTGYMIANLGSTGSAAIGSYVNGTAYPVRIGNSNQGSGGPLTTPGVVYELWASSTPFDDANVRRIEAGVLGQGGLTVTRTTTATYDQNGTQWTAPAGVARITSSGLLVEGARTNLTLQSAAFDNASWLKVGLNIAAPIVTADQASAPDGSTTADQVAFAASTGAGQESAIYQSATATAVPYSFSVWLRKASGSGTVYVGVTDGTTYYNQPCAVTTAWSRCSVSTAALTAIVWYWQIGVDTRAPSGQPTSQAAQTVYLWGAEMEAGSFASSYIPTTTTAATRNADLVTTPYPLTDPTQFCVRITQTPANGGAWSALPVLFAGLSFGGASQWALLANGGGPYVSVFDAVGASRNFIPTSPGWAAGSTHGLGAAYKSPSADVYLDAVRTVGTASGAGTGVLGVQTQPLQIGASSGLWTPNSYLSGLRLYRKATCR